MADTPQRLRVNPLLCKAAGFCAEIAPELVALDEWGYPIIDRHPLGHGEAALHARRAIAVCPRQALRLEPIDPARER